jgi:hypothetical protein
MPRLSVLTIVAITTVMTFSMHGYVLAVGEPGYRLTVNIPSYPSGTSTIGISITTASGYMDHAKVDVSGVTSWIFNIPSNQGSSVQACINSDSSSGENCNTYGTTGTDMSVSLSPPSGNTYYVYPGNTYYIYPGNSYGHYHDHDHWFSGHEDSSNNGVGGYGGHSDSGNVVNGGNQNTGNNGVGGYGGHQDNGNTGYGGHQDHWLGGHQDNGNTGYGGHQNTGNNGLGSGKNGFSGHQDSGNRSISPSLPSISIVKGIHS